MSNIDKALFLDSDKEKSSNAPERTDKKGDGVYQMLEQVSSLIWALVP